MEAEVKDLWYEIELILAQHCLKNIELKNKEIFLFGAGRVGRDVFDNLKGNYNISGFVDNNSKLWGKFVDGIPVFAPDEVLRRNDCFVIITIISKYCNAVRKQLCDIGVKNTTWLEYLLFVNKDKFNFVLENQLCDTFSKVTYLKLILAQITGNREYRNQVFCRNQYFALPEFNMPLHREIFVDCGAYVGDTIEDYIRARRGSVNKIIAFEPNERIFHALKSRRNRLVEEWTLNKSNIKIERKALGRSSDTCSMLVGINGEAAARIDDASKGEIDMVSLDEYLADVVREPLFIKVDIEGYEKMMLYGAMKLIKERKPLIAISIYHKSEDLYEIPLLIKSWNPDYKMSIRSHMPDDMEIVLYCY